MKKGRTVWLTGLPCSGKTTISLELVKRYSEFKDAIVLDGDIIRGSIHNPDMTLAGRRSHLSYMAYFCKLLNDLGHYVICSFVSPTNDIRKMISDTIGRESLFLVFVDCPKEVCIQRDVKGMWAKAINGEIEGFTGHDGAWEDPDDTDLIVYTHEAELDEICADIRDLFFNFWVA